MALAGNERVAVVAGDHQSLPNAVRGQALTALVKYMLATYPELAEFLVRHGVDSISVNPQSLARTLEVVAAAEQRLAQSPQLADA